MTELTQAGRQALADIASRHGVSAEAAEHLLYALIAGQGTQAQFNHPDLGGMGQWSLGGMTMVGDMFNNQLKARVDAICSDIAELMRQSAPLHVPQASASQSQSQGDGVSLFVAGGSFGNWWPDDLGHAASTGAQNRMRYAWFPETARLALDSGDGKVRVYDTADHRIGGFSQQQSGDQSLSFTSQHGLVKLSDLREIEPAPAQAAGADRRGPGPALSEALLKASAGARAPDAPAVSPQPHKDEPVPAVPDAAKAAPVTTQATEESDIFDKIERLAGLHAKGILTEAEFQAKKAELLARI